MDEIPQAKELKVDVAVVDGNLGNSDIDCKHGRLIAEALRAAIPSIRIIALSSSEEADYGDIYVAKHDLRELIQLSDIVTSL